MELEKTIALLLAGTALITSPVFAQEVGTATAVNPESQSTPPGGSTSTALSGYLGQRARRSVYFPLCSGFAVTAVFRH